MTILDKAPRPHSHRVPLPPEMENWPRGLRPVRARVTDDGVFLLYLHPECGWAEVWVNTGAGKLAVSLGESDELPREGLRRLVVALQHRFEDPQPCHWVASVMKLRGELQPEGDAVRA